MTTKNARFNTEQRKAILAEATSKPVSDVCKAHSISATTFYKWKHKYSGVEPKRTAVTTKSIGKLTEVQQLKLILADVVLGKLDLSGILSDADRKAVPTH